MIGTAELVLFAIQSAIRLAEASRRAFVDSTRGRVLTLPLPNFGGTVDEQSAARFYRGDGREFNVEGSRIRTLTDRVSGGATLEEPERSEYVDLYLEDRALLIFRAGRTTDLRAGSLAGVGAEDWQHLLEIRQWRPGARPEPLARPAHRRDARRDRRRLLPEGSLPGSDRPSHRQGPRHLPGRDRRRVLLHGEARAAGGLALRGPRRGRAGEPRALRRRRGLAPSRPQRDDGPGGRCPGAHRGSRRHRERGARRGWARLVFRSILRSTGETILSAPELYLGARDGGATLAGNVGLAVLDAVVGENTVDLRALFTQETMDGVMKAALRAVAASPRLAGIPHQGVAQLVRSVVGDLAASTTVVGPDLLPEAIRIVLDRTAEHADALLPAGGAPADLLLARAGRTLLEGLAAPDPSGTWRPRFEKQDVLTTLEAVVGEVAQNPAWLAAAAGGGSSHLATAVRAALAALAGMEEPRLRPASALVVVRAPWPRPPVAWRSSR